MESISNKKEIVSVIIAVYNGELTLAGTINSLLSQTYKNLEIILVDDGSTDNSAAVIKGFNDERIKYFFQKNTGSPVAPRNKGIKESSGKFIAFCDQDDVWYPEKLEKQLETYQKCENKKSIGIIITSANLIDEKGKIINQNPTPFEGFLSQKEAFKKLLGGDFITACSVLVPKKIINEIGFLDEALKGVDDYDLWLRITQKYGILAISEPLCAWRKLNKALSADKTQLYFETEKVFKKLNDKTNEIRIGHGKNLMRYLVTLLLKSDYKKAKTVVDTLKLYPVSKKANILIRIFDKSNVFAGFLIKVLDKIGRISL